ncbi:unnamed protein product [Mytilus coruscus]|uniref:Uncharacterized protein n=1 Tax=Mytilus coruscus TaxID=42192 RepID=A0A6J8EV87_MYTCO|nr:unnamed protein product [Mytilus coruscus]
MLHVLPTLCIDNVIQQPNGLTWFDASHKCGDNGLEFDEKILMNIKRLREGNREFWFGMAMYRLRTPWIQIIGCYRVDESTTNKYPSLVLCQSSCNSSTFFGYNNFSKACICLSEATDNRINITTCNIRNSSDVYFVYKKYKGNDIEGSGSCAILFCKDGKTKLNATNCQTRGNQIATVCDDNTKAISKSYTESMNLCFARNKLLLHPGTSCRHRNNSIGFYAWSNVFRAEMGVKLTKEEAGSSKPLKCLSGIIDASNNHKYLNIIAKNCSTKLKWAVCRNENQNVTGSFTKSDSSMEKEFDDLTLLKYIGPIVGGVLAIAVTSVVAVLIVRRRRKNDPLEKIDDTKPTECSNAKQGISLHAYIDSNGRKDYTRNSFGMEVIKSAYEGVEEQEQKHTTYCEIGDTYMESSIEEYDTSNNVNRRKQSAHGNLYDTAADIRDPIDPTYNTLERSPNVDNNVYVHSLPSGKSESD